MPRTTKGIDSISTQSYVSDLSSSQDEELKDDKDASPCSSEDTGDKAWCSVVPTFEIWYDMGVSKNRGTPKMDGL